MQKSFEQMSGAERQEWRAELKRHTENPGDAQYIDPRLESVYEFRPELNATVEKTPDGQRFIVVFRDGRLTREKILEKDSESGFGLTRKPKTL